MEPGSFWWCPVTGLETIGKHWNTRDSLNFRRHFFYWWWLAFGTGCTERLCSFSRWRHSRGIWTRCSSCATWLCLTRGIGPDGLLRWLPTSILWLSELEWANDSKLWQQGFKWDTRMVFQPGGLSRGGTRCRILLLWILCSWRFSRLDWTQY